MADSDSRRPIAREDRITSHVLVEFRMFKHLPIKIHSAVLLDISEKGFKAEFTGEIQARSGERFWMAIPLAPLGIGSPRRLYCRAECKWFDLRRFRVGGVFLDLGGGEKKVIEQVIATLRTRGGLLPTA